MNGFSITVFILAGLTALALTACARQPKPKMMPLQKWSLTELEKHTLTLQDSQQVQTFIFGEGNSVAAILGSKETVTNPLLSWEIDKDGALNIYDDGKTITFRLVKLERLAQGYKVDCNGEIQTYILS